MVKALHRMHALLALLALLALALLALLALLAFALLDMASEHDELDRKEEYHKRLRDLLVEIQSIAGVIGLRKPRMENVKLGRIE